MKTFFLGLSFAVAHLASMMVDPTHETAWIERDSDGFRVACGDSDGNEVSCTTEPATDECGAL